MSIRYRNQNGQEVICSGLTPGGDIEAGAVMEKKGTWTFSSSETPIAAGAMVYKDIVFDTPMPDADYLVTYNSYGGQGDEYIYVKIGNKTVDGFRIYATNTTTTSHGIGYIKWIATKTYTVQHAQQNAESIATIEAMVPSGAGAGNKLVTKSYVDNADNALDLRLDDIEDVIPVGASINNQLVTKSEASVDNTLSSTSEHAVQNKVVKAALDNKQDTLIYDNVPTADSTNPVKSGGIYKNLSNPNILDNPFFTVNSRGYTTYTKTWNWTLDRWYNGTLDSVVINNDGSVTLNSADTTKSNRLLRQIIPNPEYYNGKTLTLSVIDGNNNFYSNTGTFTLNGGYGMIHSYLGTDAVVKMASYSNLGEVRIELLSTGTTVTIKAIKLELGNVSTLKQDSIPDYVTELAKCKTRTIEGGDTLYQNRGNLLTTTDLGFKNVLPVTTLKGTSYGITFSVRSDGAVIANGTATGGQAIFQVNYNLVLSTGRSFLISGGHSAQKFCYVNAIDNGSYVKTIGLSTGDSTNQYEVNPFIPDYVGYTYLEIGIAINEGQTCNNEVFYPMIRFPEILDDTYEGYAMNNQALTDRVKDITKFRCMELPVEITPAGTTLTIQQLKDWLDTQNLPYNTKLILHSSRNNEKTLIGTYTQPNAWGFLAFSYTGIPELWQYLQGNYSVKTFTVT